MLIVEPACTAIFYVFLLNWLQFLIDADI